jgi:hypothetical protein
MAPSSVSILFEPGGFSWKTRCTRLIPIGPIHVRLGLNAAETKAGEIRSSKFTQADGTTVSSERFLLHKMGVGDHVVTDVVANVIPVAGEPLLGQTFLGRLPSWTFDNNQHTLAIGEGETKTALVEAPRTAPKQPVASDETAITVICGQSIPAPRSSTVMVGSWQRPKGGPLCAGFIAVASANGNDIGPSATEAEYVYGKGTRLHLTGEYDNLTKAFTFHDQQGGTFIFWTNGSASFRGGSGQLSGNFAQQTSSQPAAFVTTPPKPAFVPEDSEGRAKRAIRICIDQIHRMASRVDPLTAQFYQSFDAYYNSGDKLVHNNGWQNGHIPVQFQFNKCMAEHGFPLSKPR